MVKLSLCLTKHHTMETYWGSGGIAPRIFHLDTRWRWVVSFTLRPLYLQEHPRYPSDGRLVKPQSRCGRGSEEKKISTLPLPGIEPGSFSPLSSLYSDWESQSADSLSELFQFHRRGEALERSDVCVWTVQFQSNFCCDTCNCTSMWYWIDV